MVGREEEEEKEVGFFSWRLDMMLLGKKERRKMTGESMLLGRGWCGLLARVETRRKRGDGETERREVGLGFLW